MEQRRREWSSSSESSSVPVGEESLRGLRAGRRRELRGVAALRGVFRGEEAMNLPFGDPKGLAAVLRGAAARILLDSREFTLLMDSGDDSSEEEASGERVGVDIGVAVGNPRGESELEREKCRAGRQSGRNDREGVEDGVLAGGRAGRS